MDFEENTFVEDTFNKWTTKKANSYNKLTLLMTLVIRNEEWMNTNAQTHTYTHAFPTYQVNSRTQNTIETLFSAEQVKHHWLIFWRHKEKKKIRKVDTYYLKLSIADWSTA